MFILDHKLFQSLKNILSDGKKIYKYNKYHNYVILSTTFNIWYLIT